MEKTFVLNFSHPLARGTLDSLRRLGPCEEIRVSFQLDLDREWDAPGDERKHPTHAQVLRIVARAERELQSRGESLATASILVVLPGLVEGAAVLLAELHGRGGRFPPILALRHGGGRAYHLLGSSTEHGVLELEKIRNTARERR